MGESARTERPIVAVTMGDCAGIGPEVVLKALAREDVRRCCAPLVVGDASVMERAAESIGLPLRAKPLAAGLYPEGRAGCIEILDWAGFDPGSAAPGIPDEAACRAAFECIKKAVDLARSRLVDAIATAPVNKKGMREAGIEFPGHTEVIAALTGTDEVAMMLAWDRFRVTLATTHLPLAEVARLLTPEKILTAIKLTGGFLVRWGLEKPRIAVAALNPHCGEGGLLGREEADIIEPAIATARAAGWLAEGPFPADSLFARLGDWPCDAAVAMYHDQGMMPIKLLSASRAVNVTLGLPIVRTSPDHGTAYDIAGRNCADESSMAEAIKMAAKLARLPRKKGAAPRR